MRPKQPGRLINLIRSGQRPCCVMLPGAGGGIGPYLRLASFLGLTHNVVAVRAVGLLPDEIPETSVAAMADSALAAVRAAGVKPDLIFGWSLGGTIGWEMCLRLADLGQQPDLVMLDSSPLARQSSAAVDTQLCEQIIKMLGPRPDELTRHRVQDVIAGQLVALDDYWCGRSYSGRTLLLTCSDDLFPERVKGNARWRELAPNLVEGVLGVGHFDVFGEDHHPALTKQIAEFMCANTMVTG